jgi:hypothetical protein
VHNIYYTGTRLSGNGETRPFVREGALKRLIVTVGFEKKINILESKEVVRHQEESITCSSQSDLEYDIPHFGTHGGKRYLRNDSIVA